MIFRNNRPFILVVRALIFATLAPVAFAQSHEIQAAYFKLKGPAADLFPETNYTRISMAYAHTSTHNPGSPEFQWVAGGTISTSGEAHYAQGSAGSGTLKPANYLFGGLRVLSPGTLQFGLGVDLRVEADRKSFAYGDTGGSENGIKVRPWVLAQASYKVRAGGIGVRMGLQASFAADDGARPSKELGVLVGHCF